MRQPDAIYGAGSASAITSSELQNERSLPAIAETAATGAIAEIFADIRGVLRVEVVNLIWRHLATLPGALGCGGS